MIQRNSALPGVTEAVQPKQRLNPSIQLWNRKDFPKSIVHPNSVCPNRWKVISAELVSQVLEDFDQDLRSHGEALDLAHQLLWQEERLLTRAIHDSRNQGVNEPMLQRLETVRQAMTNIEAVLYSELED